MRRPPAQAPADCTPRPTHGRKCRQFRPAMKDGKVHGQQDRTACLRMRRMSIVGQKDTTPPSAYAVSRRSAVGPRAAGASGSENTMSSATIDCPHLPHARSTAQRSRGPAMADGKGSLVTSTMRPPQAAWVRHRRTGWSTPSQVMRVLGGRGGDRPRWWGPLAQTR